MTGYTVSLYGCKCADDSKKTCVQGPTKHNIGSQAAIDAYFAKETGNHKVDLSEHLAHERNSCKSGRIFFRYGEYKNGKPNPEHYKLEKLLTGLRLVNDKDWAVRRKRKRETLAVCGCHIRKEALVRRKGPKGAYYKLDLEYKDGSKGPLLRPKELAQIQGVQLAPSAHPRAHAPPRLAVTRF